MRKLLGTCALVALISCAAVWGTQRIGLFPRLSGALSSLVFGTSNANHAKPAKQTAQDSQASANATTDNGQVERPNKRTLASPLDSWKNVCAYVAVFAFVVMATYYGEQVTNRFWI